MLKTLLLVGGASIGAASTAAWLLSKPDLTSRVTPGPASSAESLEVRIEALKLRLRSALNEAQQTGPQTEEQLRRRLDGYRKGASVPG